MHKKDSIDTIDKTQPSAISSHQPGGKYHLDMNTPLGRMIKRLYENNPIKNRDKLVLSDHELHVGWMEQCRNEKRTKIEYAFIMINHF